MIYTRRTLCKILKSELVNIDFNNLPTFLSQFPPKDLISPLFSFICRHEKELSWRAISAFGIVVCQMSETSIEDARVVMRRFLWSLNDESGGIGWGAPQAMASIMAAKDDLFYEYIHMLISYMRGDGPLDFQDGNYLEHPFLQRGLLWGIGELCKHQKDKMLALNIESDLVAYLISPDVEVVVFAYRALMYLGFSDGEMLNDVPLKEMEFYENGLFVVRKLPSFIEV
ncbi:MAG: hypothetical protein OCC45_07475 [Desulfotalea sp.]